MEVSHLLALMGGGHLPALRKRWGISLHSEEVEILPGFGVICTVKGAAHAEHMARMKLTPGSIAPALVARTILGQSVRIPSDGAPYLHLQFRRFAGCPVCNFHLRTMSLRQPEIAAAGVRQIVFFHSSPEEMLEYQAQLPFDCIADPTKRYYRAYGVETSWRAVLHPGVFWSGLRWVLSTGRFYRKAENGIQGLHVYPFGGVASTLKWLRDFADDPEFGVWFGALESPPPDEKGVKEALAELKAERIQ